MAISISKSGGGIDLKKGNSIKLEKDGKNLSNVCIGVNWGAISRTGITALIFGRNKAVDLDASVSLFGEGKRHLETVYYNKLRSTSGAIIHSGDDLVGDEYGDDGLDNEIIRVNTDRIDSEVKEVFFYLNSYNQVDFADVPYSHIRVYEGTPKRVDDVLATMNLSSDPDYKGFVSMVMGRLYRADGGWKFEAIGKPVPAKDIKETIQYIKNYF